MKRWKKVLLALAALLVVSQAPFAYRRYRLGRLAAAVAALDAEHVAAHEEDAFKDYAGVLHVHSALGGHSAGTFDEIVRAAKSNGLAFVVMTEHPAEHVNTAEATLKGLHEGVLFINGSELAARDGGRLFVAPGFAHPPPDSSTLQELVNRAKGEGRLAVVAYPEQVRDWKLDGYDGVEVYNLYTNAQGINYALLFFDGLWSYWSYPELLFATFYERPSGNLKRWDELGASGRVRAAALAGNDAHANVGLSLQQPDGERLLEIKLDPYERSFRVVRNHVVLSGSEPLDARSLLAALRLGHSFIAFDLFCDATGFRFTAEGNTRRAIMGDEIPLDGAEPVRLKARAPVRSRFVFFRDGQVVHEERDVTRAELPVERSGVYRVEAYLDQLGSALNGKPWIISNPIYVR
jgi:hypothetical protein